MEAQGKPEPQAELVRGDDPEESPWTQEVNRVDDEAANAILQNLAAIYVATHDYHTVEAEKFLHLDLRFYDSGRDFLRGEGFSFLCDVQDRTLEQAPGNILRPIFLRALVSAEGTISAAIYHARIKPLWLRLLLFVMGKSRMKVVEFETEFVDGSYVCTSNAMSASMIKLPPSIDVLYLPARTSPERVLVLHRQRVRDRQNRFPGIRPLTIGSFQDLIASQNRMNALKAAFRGEIGGITREELERLALLGKGGAMRVADRIEVRK